jgi:hypothetical protein
MFNRVTVLALFSLLMFGIASHAQERASQPRRLEPKDTRQNIPQSVLDRQYQALSAMPSGEVVYGPLGSVRRLAGHTGITLSANTRSSKHGDFGHEVYEKLRSALLAKGTETLRVRSNVNPAGSPYQTIALDQSIRGIPVLGSDVQIRFEQSTGLVESLSASFVPDYGLPAELKLEASQAFSSAARLLEDAGTAAEGSVRQIGDPMLAYQSLINDADKPRLVWAIVVEYRTSDGETQNSSARIDSIDGSLVLLHPLEHRVIGAHQAVPVSLDRTANSEMPPPTRPAMSASTR